MQGRQLPPIIELNWPTNSNLLLDPATRRRNRSLHINPEVHQAPTPSLPLKRQPVYTSRKNKLLLKQLKSKKGRDYTQRCQDNIDQYITLRNIALDSNKRQHSPEGSEGCSGEHKTTLSQRTYIRNKLSLKMLTFPDQSNMTIRGRCRTEGDLDQVKEEKAPEAPTKVKLLRVDEARESTSVPKPYKDMSVEEITGSGRGQGRLIERLREFRAGIEEHRCRRKDSEEMLIEGW